jgi:putative membrane protein
MPPSDPPPHGDPPASPVAGADPEAPPPQTEPARARLTEGQVARITELANIAEIEQAKLAESRAKSKSVKHFAAMMVKDHNEAKNEQAKLYKDLAIAPADSQRSRTLKQDADKTLGQLRAANGAPFDTAYMDAQVTEHQQVLDLINQELVPSATQDKLVSSLNKMKTTVEAHLKEAKVIQGELIDKRTSTNP